MIARMWHGRTRADKADEYLEFLIARAIPDYKSVAGNRSVEIFRRVENGVAHFITLTHWDSIESIEAFAGKDIARAKYYPEDKKFLLEFEPTVQHFEVYAGPV